MTPFLYAMLCATLHYLGARAVITEPLWRRYPPEVAHWARCAACSGTWYGIMLGALLGWGFNLPFLGLPGRHLATPLVVGLCATWWTPVLAWIHVYCLFALAGLDQPAEEPSDVGHPKS
jgi:hypothetical protein